MNHILYETKNLVNGMIYRGIHSTEDLNDGYLGSGKLLKRAVSKYGREHFVRRVLKHCMSRDDAYMWEAHYVTKEFVALGASYNIVLGGRGTGCGENHPLYGRHLSVIAREKIGNANKLRIGDNNPFFNKKHTDVTKQKMRDACSGPLHRLYGKKQPRSTCPHCGKQGSVSNMSRWHNDNCKLKEMK